METGLPIKKYYTWFKQPNGKYTIKDVEVLKTYESKTIGKLSASDADTMIASSVADAGISKFPRVHIGHNPENYGNRVGCGYLTNLQRRGEVVYGDIVEIPEAQFQEINDLKYPARSAEFDKETFHLDGLALLESQPAFCAFPILALAGNEGEQNENFNENLIKLQKNINKKNTKGVYMADDKDKELNGDEKEKLEDKEKDIENSEDEKEKLEDKEEETPAWAEKMLDAQKKILGALQTLIGKEEEEAESSDENEPEPVAQEQEKQSKYGKNKMQKSIESLARKLEKLERKSFQTDMDEELEAVCEENGHDFDTTRATLQKFTSERDRKVYLESLRHNSVKFQEHPATAILSRGISTPQGNPIQKWQKYGPSVQKLAKGFYTDWKDTVSQPNTRAAKIFRTNFPTPESYIEMKMSELEGVEE